MNLFQALKFMPPEYEGMINMLKRWFAVSTIGCS